MRVGIPSEFQTKNRILVCAVAAYLGRPIPKTVMKMVNSCKKQGMAINLFAVDKEYCGFYKSNLEEQRLCLITEKNNYDWVLSIDAYDTIIVRPLEEIFKRVPKDCMFFNAERNNYPDATMIYPPCETSYRYLNGGCFFGPMNLVIDCFNYHNPNPFNCNQYAWAKAYTEKALPIRIDSCCEVFQTLWGVSDQDFNFIDGLPQNLETGTHPCVIHGNGNAREHVTLQRYW